MKKTILLISALIAITSVFCQNNFSHQQKLKEWQDARFGMFIHWGPVSLKGTEIGWSRGKEITVAEYDTLYKHHWKALQKLFLKTFMFQSSGIFFS